MAKSPAHTWTFARQFRAGAFGWRTAPAVTRMKQAVAEIRKAARRDPVLGAEGAVRFFEKLAPAIERVDSSSGSLGTAVHRVIETLVPVIASAPAEDATRDVWLDRLWQAFQDDDMPFLEHLGDSWGELCAGPERASRWADLLLPALRGARADPRPGAWCKGTYACFSSLLAAGRYEELLRLLDESRHPGTQEGDFRARALAATGRIDAALAAGGCDPVVLEQILLDAGRREEAYRLCSLPANRGTNGVATFRAIAKKYPEKEPRQILADLIRGSPGREGRWFATARQLGELDLALELARTAEVDPRTLNRAARDLLGEQPEFAREVALAALDGIVRGLGYEITGHDAFAAVDLARRAAKATAGEAETEKRLRRIADRVGPGDPWLRNLLSLALRRGESPGPGADRPRSPPPGAPLEGADGGRGP